MSKIPHLFGRNNDHTEPERCGKNLLKNKNR